MARGRCAKGGAAILVLDIKPGEQLTIGEAIVEVREIRCGSVRLAIEADRERVPVVYRRGERSENTCQPPEESLS